MVATDPERKQVVATYSLKLNGSKAPDELDAAVIDVAVDERLHLPAMFEIRLHNPGMRWLDEETLREGKEIEILAGREGELKSLCIGKITALDADLSEGMPALTVRGYDLSFSLHRDVRSRSFVQQTDSDIAKKVANDAEGLTPKVDATSEVHPYVFQQGQTNYAFLLDRADRIGYEMRVVGRDLLFREPKPDGSPVELTWSVNLKRFRPHLSVAEQVDEVQVRGWDVKAKDAIVGTATNGHSAPSVGENRPGGVVAKGVWGRAKRVITDSPVASKSEADTVAQAVLDDLTSSFIRADGECNGDPRLRVGTAISIKGVGKRFGGTYYLTAVTHRFSKGSGHQVRFTASNRRPTTVTGLLRAPDQRALTPAVVVGLVTNLDDPEKLGRVKVKFPWMYDNDESNWARLVQPMGGKGRGFLTMPEVNDEVLVAFEHGDPRFPYVLGGLWNGKDEPPSGTGQTLGSGVVNQRFWRSRTGHLIVLDDGEGNEGITIVDKTGNNHIKIISGDNKLDVHLDGNIEVTSNDSISLKARKDVSIQAESGTVSIKGIDVAVEAEQSASIKTGTSLAIQAGTSCSLQAGTSISVTAGADLSLTAGAAFSLSAASLGINASGATNVTSGGAFALNGGGSFAVTSGGAFDVTSGAAVSVTAATSAQLTGAAQAKVMGAMVEIDGAASVKVTGAMINLN